MATQDAEDDVVFEDKGESELELDLSVNVAERTDERQGFAALCSRLGDALLVGDGLESMMRELLNRAFDLIPAQRGSICVYDAERQSLVPVVSRRGPAAAPISISRSITDQVIDEKRALLVTDAGDDDRFSASESIMAMNIHSVMCAPMYHHGVVEGLIYLDTVSNEGGFLSTQFDEEHLEMLVAIAVFAAVCVEKARLLERIQEESAQRLQVANRIRVMLDVAKSLSSELDTNVLIRKIMQSARELMQAERCTLFMLDHDSRELWTKVADGGFEIRIPMTKGIAGEVATAGRVLNIPDAYADPRFNPEADKQSGFRTRNILCMPVRNNEGTIIGVTQMINKIGDGPFTMVDEELLEAFSAQTAVALENAMLFQQTLEMQKYLESILKSITNLVATLDNEGRIVTANHPVEPFLGVDDEMLLKQPYTQWFDGENADLIEDIRRVLAADSKPVYVADYELKHHGKTISLNYNIVPLLDFEEAQKGAVLVLENISQQKRVMGTLARHLGSGVAQQLLDGEESRLGGVRQDVTILFSDIRGYTSLTESMDAGEIVAMLNDYFSLMIDEIFAEEGVLDKYIGDALMAVFGVPFPSPADAARACRCALRMMKSLDIFNGRLKRQNRRPIAIGIGINSGEVISGNIGSEKRLEYTCIGDAVNLASRLEGASKTYGVPIILQETTRQAIGPEFLVRELDLIRVKGKQQPARIYELLGSKDQGISAPLADALPHFDDGLKAYRALDFAAAEEHFQRAHALAGDRPSKLFEGRCEILKQQPPRPDWDGVWEMTTK